MIGLLSCQSILQRIGLQASLEFPDLGTWISRTVQLVLLPPLRKATPLQRSMLSSSGTLIQISQYGYRSEPPIPPCSSSRVGHQQSRCPRRLPSCQQYFCLRNLSAVSGFPTRYRAARFNGTKSNSRGSLILWAKYFAVSAGSSQGSMSNLINPNSSTPTLNTRFNNRKLFMSESSNPSVPIAVYFDLRRLSMCLSPSSPDKHKVVAVH